jgi:hypothetical protein
MSNRHKASNYPVSDEFITWAESLAGLLTKLETKYGGVHVMLEDAGWDQGRTQHAASLVADLAMHLERIRKEMVAHANETPF